MEYDFAGEVCGLSYLSMLYDDCMERGKGIFSGGIRYLGGTLESYGNVNTADSLTAIRKPVSYTHLDVYKRQHTGRPLGNHGRHVGGAGHQHPLRGIPGAAVPLWETFYQGRIRKRNNPLLAPGCVRLFRRISADYEKERHEVFHDDQDFLESV